MASARVNTEDDSAETLQRNMRKRRGTPKLDSYFSYGNIKPDTDGLDSESFDDHKKKKNKRKVKQAVKGRKQILKNKARTIIIKDKEDGEEING